MNETSPSVPQATLTAPMGAAGIVLPALAAGAYFANVQARGPGSQSEVPNPATQRRQCPSTLQG